MSPRNLRESFSKPGKTGFKSATRIFFFLSLRENDVPRSPKNSRAPQPSRGKLQSAVGAG